MFFIQPFNRITVIGIITMVLFSLHLFGQKTDSLWKIYSNKYNHDTVKLDALHLIINEIQRIEPDSAISLAKLEINEANKKQLFIQEAKGYTALGLLLTDKGEFDKSIIHQKKALLIMTEVGNEKGIANCLNNIGINYLWKSDFTQALNYFLQSLKKRERMKDSLAIAQSYSNIGIVYSELKEYTLAQFYFLKALVIKQKIKDKNIAALYSNIAALFGDTKKYIPALFYEKKALDISIKNNNYKMIAQSYQNIGSTYEELQNHDSSLYYQNKAIEIRKKIGDRMGLATSYANLVGVYNSLQQYKTAVLNGEQSLVILNEIGAKEIEIDVHKSLANTYYKSKNFEKSLFHYQIYTQIKDSLFNLEKTKELSDLKTQFEVKKTQQKLFELAQEKEKNIILISVLLFLALTGIGTFVYVRNKKQKYEHKTQKIILEQKLLRLQMNPHFIFNCLSSIQSYIAMYKPEEANKYLSNLSVIMRRVLEDSKFEYISLEKEIIFLENYLSLQNLVTENEFDFQINFDGISNLNTISIPSMLIQPFVENAIFHGVSKMSDGFVSIKFSLIDTVILCSIEDNGVGISNSLNENKSKHQSMAIQIVKERITYLKKGTVNNMEITINDALNKTGEIKGTIVEMRLPFIITNKII